MLIHNNQLQTNLEQDHCYTMLLKHISKLCQCFYEHMFCDKLYFYTSQDIRKQLTLSELQFMAHDLCHCNSIVSEPQSTYVIIVITIRPLQEKLGGL